MLDTQSPTVSSLLFQLAARLDLPVLRRILTPMLRGEAPTVNARTTSGRRRPGGSSPTGKGEKTPLPPDDMDPQSPQPPSLEPRKTLFQLKAPAAQSVKLVADFTDWEKYPLDMIQCEEGNWFAIVPLAPGSYSYRFIVDGQWFNDPATPMMAPNPFGSENAVVHVS